MPGKSGAPSEPAGREESPVDGGPVDIFVYFDYVCPFSYITDARLWSLVEESRVRVRFHWRPLSIHPAVPTDGLPVDQLGIPPDEWARMEKEVSSMARELGLPMEIPGFVSNSHEALQMSEFAKDVGEASFRETHRALFRAYFVEGRNLGLRSELLATASEVGLDRQALEGALEDARYEDELDRVRSEARRYEVEGTPTILFGRHKVVGAAPPEVLREALRRAVGESREG